MKRNERENKEYAVRLIVSPAYGYIESALVKCSNEGGLGPRHNMKRDHGSSIFNRQVVYYLHLLTSSRKQVTGRINGHPFPLLVSHPCVLNYILLV